MGPKGWCRGAYLPLYSPDLNPIEKAWAKLKQLLARPKHEPKKLSIRPSPRFSHGITPEKCTGLVQTRPQRSTIKKEKCSKCCDTWLLGKFLENVQIELRRVSDGSWANS